MISFTYNDMEFTAEAANGRWIVARAKTVVGAGLFADVPADEIETRARRLVQTIFPVGIRCVGPDVARPIKVGDLKIVPPAVARPNFIYWNKESASFPQDTTQGA